MLRGGLGKAVCVFAVWWFLWKRPKSTDRQALQHSLLPYERRAWDQSSHRDELLSWQSTPNTHQYIHTYMHTYIHSLHTYMHTYVYIYTYIHTFIYTQKAETERLEESVQTVWLSSALTIVDTRCKNASSVAIGDIPGISFSLSVSL